MHAGTKSGWDRKHPTIRIVACKITINNNNKITISDYWKFSLCDVMSDSSDSSDADEDELRRRELMASCVAGAELSLVAPVAKPSPVPAPGWAADGTTAPKASTRERMELVQRLSTLITRSFELADDVWDARSIETASAPPSSGLRLFAVSTTLQLHRPPPIADMECHDCPVGSLHGTTRTGEEKRERKRLKAERRERKRLKAEKRAVKAAKRAAKTAKAEADEKT